MLDGICLKSYYTVSYGIIRYTQIKVDLTPPYPLPLINDSKSKHDFCLDTFEMVEKPLLNVDSE